MYEIRAATIEDVPALVEFGAAYVPSFYAPIIGEKAAAAFLEWWSENYFNQAINGKNVFVAVAPAEDRAANTAERIVGVAEWGTHEGQPVLWRLYVAPDLRSRGVGAQLLQQIIAALPESSKTLLTEHVGGNLRAAAFYEREGFKLLRRDAHASGDTNRDTVWREKQLANLEA